MKIALLSSTDYRDAPLSGKNVHQFLLEKALKQQNIDIHTYYYRWNIRQKVKILLCHPHYKFLDRPTRKLIRINDIINFFDRIGLEEYHIVHAQDVIPIYAVKHPRIILTLHGYYFREILRDYGENTLSRLVKKIEEESVKKAAHIIAVDKGRKKYLMEVYGYPEKNITVIPNAVDIDKFSPVSEEEKIFLRKKLRLPLNTFIVLIPARYSREKGLEYAIEAAKKLGKNIHFIFIGIGPLKKELINLAQDLSSVSIKGPIPHNKIDKWYKASDIILIPSIKYEGIEEATSLSMLEGMACGKIVVCTDVGGMREVIKDGVNGILIPQKDPEAIGNIILNVYRHYGRFKSIGLEARKYVLKYHSYLDQAKKIVEIYKKVLRGDR